MNVKYGDAYGQRKPGGQPDAREQQLNKNQRLSTTRSRELGEEKEESMQGETRIGGTPFPSMKS